MLRRAISTGTSAPDLARRVVRALEFARRCVCSLQAREFERGPRAAPAAAPQVLGDKLVAETAMLLHAVAPVRHRCPRIDELIHDVATRLVPHARSERVRAAVCLDPGHAPDQSVAHVLLTRLGYRDERFDAILARTRSLGPGFGPERLAHRRLELHWLHRVGGWPAPRPRDERHALADSFLGRPIDALAGGRLDYYAFTHAVMYASDLGERRVRLARRRTDVAADALAALAFAMDTQDLDLATELLMTWPMLALPWQPAATFAFQRLADVDDATGRVHGLAFNADRHAALPEPDRFAYERATCYHSVYVWGFLCAAALRPGAAPPEAVPQRRRATGAADRLVEMLGASGPQPAWLQAVCRLAPRQREGLAPLLLACLLRRSASAGDLGRLRPALEIALGAGLVDAPATMQAVAFLRRSQLLAEVGASKASAGWATAHS
jgi:hypothetical protein